jgi:hypothetical protein
MFRVILLLECIVPPSLGASSPDLGGDDLARQRLPVIGMSKEQFERSVPRQISWEYDAGPDWQTVVYTESEILVRFVKGRVVKVVHFDIDK